jgi:hypothetical protein
MTNTNDGALAAPAYGNLACKVMAEGADARAGSNKKTNPEVEHVDFKSSGCGREVWYSLVHADARFANVAYSRAL